MKGLAVDFCLLCGSSAESVPVGSLPAPLLSACPRFHSVGALLGLIPFPHPLPDVPWSLVLWLLRQHAAQCPAPSMCRLTMSGQVFSLVEVKTSICEEGLDEHLGFILMFSKRPSSRVLCVLRALSTQDHLAPLPSRGGTRLWGSTSG